MVGRLELDDLDVEIRAMPSSRANSWRYVSGCRPCR
jgi:hypothetical protein